jgi:tetratricopeptide (TPR) repeat protein
MKKHRHRPAPAPAPAPSAPAAPAPPLRAIQWKRHLPILLGLWMAALAAYSNSFRAGLTFDNGIAIQQDARVRALTSANVGQIFTEEYWYPNVTTGLYRPLTTLSLLFNYAVLGNGAGPAGYHWVNFALHAINIALVYFLGLILLGEISWAGLLAALWALHPLLTESVTNIVGRADALAALGVLAGLLCHIRGGQAAGRVQAAWLAGLAVAAAVAVFSKESGVVVVAAMLCYDAAFGRFKAWRRLAAGYAVVAVPLAIFFVLRGRMLDHIAMAPLPFVDNPLVDAPLVAGALTAVKVIGKYLWLYLWPARLSCDYSYNQIPVFGTSTGWEDAAALASLAVCLAAVFFGIRAWRKGRPAAGFVVAFFFAALAPTANLLMPVGSIMAERWMYLPSLGLALGAVLGLESLERRLPAVSRRTLMAAAGVLCLAWGARTWLRNADWRDDQILWQSAAQAAPDSYKAYSTLANLLAKAAHPSLDRAIGEAERSTAILDRLGDEENLARPFAVEGMCYRLKGESLSDPAGREAWYHKALAALERARRIDLAGRERLNRLNLAHGKGQFQTGLGLVYLELGRVQRLLGQHREALESLAYGRNLSPIAEFSEEESQVYRDLGDPDRPAIALLEGLFIDPGSRRLAGKVVEFYRQTAPFTCAVETRGASSRFNLQCPLVHAHLCQAGQNVALAYRRFGNPAKALSTAQMAVASGCPAGLFQ